MGLSDEGGVTVAVIVGPGLNVDQENFARWCAQWSQALSIEVYVAACGDRDTLAGCVNEAACKDVAGIVLDPGEAFETGDFDAEVETIEVPIVRVDLREAEHPRPSYAGQSHGAVRGRGIEGFRWALQHLLQRIAWPYQTIAYGSARDQVGDLRMPGNEFRSVPVIALLHGGFWRERWERDTMEPLAIDLARRGYATWNLEYRRVGPCGGGWPQTCEDVAAGIEFLAEVAREYPIDAGRVAVIGHSVGGQLALWVAKQSGTGSTSAPVSLSVSLAGIPDLVEAARRGLGDTGNATADFMGGRPDEIPSAYAEASPLARLPLGVPQIIVQGRQDNIADLVDLNYSYVRAALSAGDDVTLIDLANADHFDLIDAKSSAWAEVVQEVERRFPPACTRPSSSSVVNSSTHG